MAANNGGITPPVLSGYLLTCGDNAAYKTARGINTGYTIGMTQIGAVSTWVKFEAADVAAVVLLKDGTMWSVGSNGACTGQGVSTGFTTTLTKIGTATDWTSNFAAFSAALAIKSDGSLWVWGSNSRYLTGRGINTGVTTTPTKLGTASWLKVATAARISAGIQADGTLWTWGDNTDGATAQGTTSGSTTTPAKVGTDTDWKFVSCGLDGLHAIKNDGTLWAAGYGPHIGFGSTVATYSTLTQVGTDTDWMMTSTACIGFVALKVGGKLYSCGFNQNGTTAQGVSTGMTEFLTQVGTDTNWTYCVLSNSPSGGSSSNGAALKSNGEVWGWGLNGSYEIGLNNNSDQLSPVKIGTATDWSQISVSDRFSGGVRRV